jgi:SPP1 family predicted phage head-tail adaptor
MTDPGLMNRQVKIRTAGASTSDGMGGYTPGEPVDVTSWAYIEPLQGDEQLQAMQTGMVRPHRFTMRYRSDLASSKTLVYQSRTFDVKSIVDTDMKHEELVILADEVVLV